MGSCQPGRMNAAQSYKLMKWVDDHKAECETIPFKVMMERASDYMGCNITEANLTTAYDALGIRKPRYVHGRSIQSHELRMLASLTFDILTALKMQVPPELTDMIRGGDDEAVQGGISGKRNWSEI